MVQFMINETIGAFVAVDNKYYGLIPKKEMYGKYREGDTVKAEKSCESPRTENLICARERSYVQMDLMQSWC